MELTESEIDRLINCCKTITDPPRRDMAEENGHRRNDFRCAAIDGDERFRVFMRQNVKFPDSFSVGLVHRMPGGTEITLFRCNGPHGEVLEDPRGGASKPHFGFHVHRASVINIASGRSPEAGGAITKEYGTFEDAVTYFLDRCGIVDAQSHFPQLGNRTY
ncbi:MAG: hypothetical protein M1617_00305 [Actinobacteria bacterium]|nr:hypothetical protein [Actinomycetota bacterium]MCL5886742.1 hypothetical protein [Actinomycetota bacterium]